MNKLFGLFLLALAFLAPVNADAASRFLTCTTTCTITAIDTTIWGSSSGGTGASVPGSSDDVILDAATCVGGTTCTATMGAGYNPTWLSFNANACTASTSGCVFNANTNANTITLSGNFGNNGAGTRTLAGGSWVLTGNSSSWSTGATPTVSNTPSVSFTGTASTSNVRKFTGGGKTYGTISVASGANPFQMFDNNTIGTLTISPGNTIYLGNNSTQTVTTITNVSGSSSAQTVFVVDGPQFGNGIISSGNSWACDWCGHSTITYSGAGAKSSTNSFDFKGNSGITITAPSAGGGGGGRIIGG